MRTVVVVAFAALLIGACTKSTPTARERAAAAVEAKEAAARARATCLHPVQLYEGSIAVNARDYLHTVREGAHFVTVPVEGLDRPIEMATPIRFILDYPFDDSYVGVLDGTVTLRRIIDAIRAGFRTMYADTTEHDIPGMANKDVRGAYGGAYHVIDDLVIEGIELCDGPRLEITIGS